MLGVSGRGTRAGSRPKYTPLAAPGSLARQLGAQEQVYLAVLLSTRVQTRWKAPHSEGVGSRHRPDTGRPKETRSDLRLSFKVLAQQQHFQPRHRDARTFEIQLPLKKTRDEAKVSLPHLQYLTRTKKQRHQSRKGHLRDHSAPSPSSGREGPLLTGGNGSLPGGADI